MFSLYQITINQENFNYILNRYRILSSFNLLPDLDAGFIQRYTVEAIPLPDYMSFEVADISRSCLIRVRISLLHIALAALKFLLYYVADNRMEAYPQTL